MTNYHHNTHPSYMIFGSSIDPISSPTVFPFDDSISMAHSQSAHSYGSSPGSARDSYLDSRFMHSSAGPGASPAFTPLQFDDPYLYTSTYDDQSPVRPTDIHPRDLDFQLMEPGTWMLDADPAPGSSYGPSSPMASSSYSSQASYEQAPGYVNTSTPAPTHRQPSTSEKVRFHCTIKGCTSKGRFSRKTDLQRHITSVHGSKKYDCPHKWCGRQGDNGFTRQDHRREHLREVHRCDIPPKHVRSVSRR